MDLHNLLSDIHVRDGILGVLVVWLLWTDRRDRVADRKFWVDFSREEQKQKEEEKK